MPRNDDKLNNMRERWRANNEIPDRRKSCRYNMRLRLKTLSALDFKTVIGRALILSVKSQLWRYAQALVIKSLAKGIGSHRPVELTASNSVTRQIK